jgi:imidazolonepropionase-like amidohydrolase
MRACTSTAAGVLRVQDRIGRIAVGLRADVAAFDGDPTVTIDDLRRPVHVLKDGVPYREPATQRQP